MYCDFFGLTTAPFRVTPDTSLFYAGGEREALLNAIVYAISHGDGMVKVIGEVGSGKTMLTRMLEKKLPDSVMIIYLPNPSLAAKDLVFAIGHELGLELDQNETKTHALVAIQKKLLEIHANNQRVVVFIDEAQCMPLDTLEELRLITNLETETDKLLQLVLFGQPELDEHLSHPSVRQIKERIIHNLYLKPFTQSEAAEYLAFRLHKAGYNGSPIFSHSALKALVKYSDGLPRRLSILADKSMLAAYAAQLRTVSAAHVRAAHGDHRPKKSTSLHPWSIALVASLLLIIAVLLFFLFNHKPTAPAITQVQHHVQQAAIIVPPEQFEEKNEPVAQEAVSLEEPPTDTPLLRQVLVKTKAWQRSLDKDIYTIQIMSAYADEKNMLEKILNRYSGNSISDNLYIYPIPNGDHTLYAVTYGGFDNYKMAKENLELLPASMKRYDPYIKKIARLQNTVE